MDDLTLEECLTELKANRMVHLSRRGPLQDDVLDMCISLVSSRISYYNSEEYRRANQ